MISKETYTKIFLQQWDKSIDDANVKLFQRKWFTNNRTKVGGGLRLTDDGYEFLIKEIDKIPFIQVTFFTSICSARENVLEKFLVAIPLWI
jgi:hypothetical protein